MIIMMGWGAAIFLYRDSRTFADAPKRYASQGNNRAMVDGGGAVVSETKRCFLLAGFPAISQIQH